ncbi:MAG: hypothetical protein AB7F66_11005 [Bacteriovoracia bacterium]
MKEENSALVEEILAQFFKDLVADDAVPNHVVDLLKKHFETKSSITPAELKVIFASTPEVS